MKLNDYFRTSRGARTSLAGLVGVRPIYLSQVAGGSGRASAELAIAIEKATAGKVTCEELRPDLDWWVVRREPPPA